MHAMKEVKLTRVRQLPGDALCPQAFRPAIFDFTSSIVGIPNLIKILLVADVRARVIVGLMERRY